jgi:hypothetical protein
VVSAGREIAAGPWRIIELIADPAAQPHRDGIDKLTAAPAGQRACQAGDVFAMALTGAATDQLAGAMPAARAIPAGDPGEGTTR